MNRQTDGDEGPGEGSQGKSTNCSFVLSFAQNVSFGWASQPSQEQPGGIHIKLWWVGCLVRICFFPLLYVACSNGRRRTDLVWSNIYVEEFLCHRVHNYTGRVERIQNGDWITKGHSFESQPNHCTIGNILKKMHITNPVKRGTVLVIQCLLFNVIKTMYKI